MAWAHLLNAHQLRLSHPESEGSEYTRGQQRLRFKGIHTLATIKGIKGSD